MIGARSAAGVLAIACFGNLSLASQADAGTYVVRQCDAAGAGLNHPAPDASSVAPTRTYATRDRCEAGERALVVDNLEQADEGRCGLWRYEVPPGAPRLSPGTGCRAR